MRTLFVHTGGIGDFLLTCPALAQLSRESSVTLAGYPGRLALAVAAGLATDAVSLDAIDFGSLFSTPSARLREFASGFDEAVVWMRDDDGAIAGGLRDCGVGEVRCFPGLPQADWHRHAAAYCLECLGFSDPGHFQLDISPEPGFQGWVIHPGSGSTTKNWSVARFESVAVHLCGKGHTVHWCLGPAEDACRAPEGTTPLRRESLVELARCLAAAEGYVGNDSGVSHLAAMVGCRTVAIFGPTDPNVWRPIGPRVDVVQGTPWPEVESVLRALQ